MTKGFVPACLNPMPYTVLQDEVQALGQLGPLLFILTVLVAELIPLFPTQPLALSAGLLFGPVEVRRLLFSLAPINGWV